MRHARGVPSIRDRFGLNIKTGKRVIGILLLGFFMAGFVVAVSSEATTNFVVSDASGEAGVYVPQGGFWNMYGDFVVGGLFVLVVGWIVFVKVGKGKK